MRADTSRATRFSRTSSRRLPLLLGAAPLALALLAASPAMAQREDQGLQLGCANDYFRLCAGVDPNSDEAERCMTKNRKRLSPECRNAIGTYDKKTGTKSFQDD